MHTERFAVEPGQREHAERVLREAGLDVEAGGVELDRQEDAWPIVVVKGEIPDGTSAGKSAFAQDVGSMLTSADTMWRHVARPSPYSTSGLVRRLRDSRIFKRS